MLDSVVIIGYSGHAYVIIETALLAGIHIDGYCEVYEQSDNPYGLKYFGNESVESFRWKDNRFYIVGIGDNIIRGKIAKRISSNKGKFINLIHPSAQVSNTARIGEGNFFNINVVVNAMVSIGSQCILNTGCIVEHESVIGDVVHIGPGAVLAGNVTIGDCTFIGANAVIKQGIRIGSNAVIGAGAVVIKDVADGDTVAGNPAKKIK